MTRILMIAALGLALIFLVGAGVGAVFPGALAAEEDRMRLVYLVALLVFLGAGGAAGRRFLSRQGLRHALIWLGIGAGLLAIYTFRDDFAGAARRMGGELAPAAAISLGDGGVELRRSADGHFIADAAVDGVRLRFLIDTGASQVALSPSDARRLGFALDKLRFSQPVSTANGQTFVARTVLKEITIGDITIRDVPATIHREGLDASLLGMSFLNRLDGYEVRRDRMILRRGE